MTDRDPLDVFFAADDIPSRDSAFRIRVMEGVARRRLQAELGLRLACGVLIGIAVLALAPVLDPVLRMLAELIGAGPVGVMGILVLTAVAGLAGYAWLTRSADLRLPGLG